MPPLDGRPADVAAEAEDASVDELVAAVTALPAMRALKDMPRKMRVRTGPPC